MTESASTTQKRFFSLSWPTILPPLLLILFAALPILLLRLTLYALLAVPLTPLIHRMGWVYRDKPMFLTGPAALFVAIVWAIIVYLLICTVRYLGRRS